MAVAHWVMTLDSIRIVQLKSPDSLGSVDRERRYNPADFFHEAEHGPLAVFAAVRGMDLVGLVRLSCSLEHGESNARFVLDRVVVDDDLTPGPLRYELMKTCLEWACQQKLLGSIQLGVYPRSA